MTGSMGHYPPGTYEGDPMAPWNEKDVQICEECPHFCPLWTGSRDAEWGICALKATRFGNLEAAAWNATVEHNRGCDEEVAEYEGVDEG